MEIYEEIQMGIVDDPLIKMEIHEEIVEDDLLLLQ